MFDGQDNLKVPVDLHTAQALALLQSYMIYEAGHMEGEFHLFSKLHLHYLKFYIAFYPRREGLTSLQMPPAFLDSIANVTNEMICPF